MLDSLSNPGVLGTISVAFKAKQLYVFLFSFSVLDGCGETAQPPSGSLDL